LVSEQLPSSYSNSSTWLKIGLFAVGLGQSFAFVLVPPLARDLGLSEVQTSTIFAISAVAWAMTSATWGRASDNFGRRNIAMIGLTGYAISLIALITPLLLAKHGLMDLLLLFPLLIAGRLINGLLGSATRPAAFAFVADNSLPSKRTKKFARLESSFLAGTVLGPLLGGFLFLFNEALPFYLFSSLAIVSAIGLYMNMPNTTKIKSANENLTKISFLEKSIFPFLVLASLYSFCQASLLQSIGFYVSDSFTNYTDLPLLISMSFALLSISTIISQYFFTDFFELNNYKLLILGSFIMILSYIQAAFATSIALFYFAIILNGIGSGMVRPANASALSLSQSPDNQGSAAGYLGSVIPIGHMLTPIIAMPIYQYNPSNLYLFSAVLCLIAVIMLLTVSSFKTEHTDNNVT
jgi:MFS family permease